MDTLAALLAALHDQPGDDVTWLALTDWLEENGEPARAELLRLQRSLPGLRPGKARYAAEERIQHLLAAGVQPCVPTLTNSIGMELALIPAGTFRMGSPPNEPRRMDDEPLHTVRITRPFYLGVFPVTQAEYRAVMRRSPSRFNRRRVPDPDVDPRRFPVESVRWVAAVSFCERLSARPEERDQGRTYRLPTEAEWEYACRAWGSPRYPFHHGMTLQGEANFHSEHPYPPDDDLPAGVPLGRPCAVGSYRPNAFGLYDMHGNVDEWCQDWFDPRYYLEGPRDDPPGPTYGDRRIVRGGSWRGQGEDCRAAVRIGYEEDEPFDQTEQIGFRVVMTLASNGSARV
jgi:uncharacterized protein (TIGR02996 family)